MRKSLHIGTIFGIEINVNYTWVIIFALVVWTLALGYFPQEAPGLKRYSYWIMAFISALFLFGSLLLHELSHSLVALRNDLPIRSITLFIFGGIANIEKEPDQPGIELKMALAGPACSIVLAVTFFAATLVFEGLGLPRSLTAVTTYVYLLNTIVALFNLVPGFPLDGGRVLRALLWKHYNDLKKATRVASGFGKGFAFILMVFGVVNLFTVSLLTGVWFIFIGLFLLDMAESSYRQVELNKTLSGVHVRDIMARDVVTVNAEAKLDDLVDNYFFKYRFTSFPVISNDILVGLLPLHNVKEVPKESWAGTKAAEIMEKLSDAIIIAPSADATAALSKMIGNGIGRLIVIEDHKVIGIVSQRDIMRLFEVRMDLEH